MTEASDAHLVLVSDFQAFCLKIVFSEVNMFSCFKQLDICTSRINPFLIILVTVVLFTIQMAY